MPFTLVAFHAHPDDEALLSGGTLARVAAEGHRVVLVSATAGEAGLADGSLIEGLGDRRQEELERSAAALGCARVEILGYPDSGSTGTPPPGTFADLDPAIPAARLAEILREEEADAITTYDSNGGYGHPDHIQVHRVGAMAAELAGTPLVLEVTVDRGKLQAIARLLARIPRVRRLIPRDRFAHAYTARSEITHAVNVRKYLKAKRAALAAHASQGTGGGSIRTVTLLLKMPNWLAAPVLGTEWFRETGRTPSSPPLDDIFATLRDFL
ncbi:MAG TPA: PIG-L family deacetylase [Marmoricola sp.]|nr:PIG-L family deacetylase [Marmoricola sp.]